MKVLYDYQIFEIQQFGGISRYYFELLKTFRKNNLLEWELPLKYSSNIYIQSEHELFRPVLDKRDPYSFFLPGIDFKGKWKTYKILNKLTGFPNEQFANMKLSLAGIRKNDFDIFHPTYYSDYYLKHLSGKPYVITVYDLIHEKLTAQKLVTDHYSVNKRKVIEKAAKVIAISESTKKDLIEVFDIDEKKIEVIYLANSMQPDHDFTGLESKLILPEKYLLFVGNRSGYKNFDRFIRSVTSILNEHKDLFIVCTGTPFTKEELDTYNRLGVNKQLIHHFIDDVSLAFLYKNALAFVFPSLYEGFGIPVLEAFSCGCPAILSNTSSLPEVGGDAAIYFNPLDADSIRATVSKVYASEILRNNMRQKGFDRINLFSWEKTAIETKIVYKKVLS